MRSSPGDAEETGEQQPARRRPQGAPEAVPGGVAILGIFEPERERLRRHVAETQFRARLQHRHGIPV